MKGTILAYDRKAKRWLVNAEDGERYAFARADWKSKPEPAEGMEVDFRLTEGRATEVYVLAGSAQNAAVEKRAKAASGNITCSIVSLGCGIIAAIGVFGAAPMLIVNRDAFFMLMAMSLTAVLLGIIAVAKRYSGKGMGIAGMLLGAPSAMVYFGLVSQAGVL